VLRLAQDLRVVVEHWAGSWPSCFQSAGRQSGLADVLQSSMLFGGTRPGRFPVIRMCSRVVEAGLSAVRHHPDPGCSWARSQRCSGIAAAMDFVKKGSGDAVTKVARTCRTS